MVTKTPFTTQSCAWLTVTPGPSAHWYIQINATFSILCWMQPSSHLFPSTPWLKPLTAHLPWVTALTSAIYLFNIKVHVDFIQLQPSLQNTTARNSTSKDLKFLPLEQCYTKVNPMLPFLFWKHAQLLWCERRPRVSHRPKMYFRCWEPRGWWDWEGGDWKQHWVFRVSCSWNSQNNQQFYKYVRFWQSDLSTVRNTNTTTKGVVLWQAIKVIHSA